MSWIETVRSRLERLVATVAAVATGAAIGRPEAVLDAALTVSRSILVEPSWLDVAP